MQPQRNRNVPRAWPLERWCAAIGACLAILLFLTAGAWRDNFHVVEPGLAFRSGQLSGPGLEYRVARHQLKAILNVRGPNPEKCWYQTERATAARLGLEHYDVVLNADLAPTSGELKELLRIYATCAKPLLIHCEAGTDRSSLASLVFHLAQGEGDEAEAEKELCFSHGHFPWRSSTKRYHVFLSRYHAWLREQDLTHKPAHFAFWANEIYKRTEDLGGPDCPIYPPWLDWGTLGQVASAER
jgi:hypothetical protein